MFLYICDEKVTSNKLAGFAMMHAHTQARMHPSTQARTHTRTDTEDWKSYTEK